jgi:surface polysaccharide O-acyltransferase-like enzyme
MAADRDARLDWIKTIGLSFVVVWHLHPIYVEGAPRIEWAVRFFEFQISLTAVPMLLLVSLCLFLPKAAQGARPLGRRLQRLGEIFLFWSVVQTILYIAVERAAPRVEPALIWQGGPALPVIGGSVFYYLFNLIVLTAAAAAFVRLPEPWRRRAAWAIVLASLAWFEVLLVQRRTLLYDRLDNFLLYVPVAFYLPRLARHRHWFATGWVLATMQDLHFGRAVDCVYGRVSIFFGALALFGYVWSAAPRPRKWVRAISLYALGIYALHKYWLYLLVVLKGAHSLNLRVGGATIHLAALGLFAGTLALTAASIALLRRTPLSRYVA